MTNAQLVAEVCRVMRGIAMNFPEGLDTIAAQLDALRPARAGDDGDSTASPPNHAPTPTSVPIRRGPGRPRKHPRPETA